VVFWGMKTEETPVVSVLNIHHHVFRRYTAWSRDVGKSSQWAVLRHDEGKVENIVDDKAASTCVKIVYC